MLNPKNLKNQVANIWPTAAWPILVFSWDPTKSREVQKSYRYVSSISPQPLTKSKLPFPIKCLKEFQLSFMGSFEFCHVPLSRVLLLNQICTVNYYYFKCSSDNLIYFRLLRKNYELKINRIIDVSLFDRVED